MDAIENTVVENRLVVLAELARLVQMNISMYHSTQCSLATFLSRLTVVEDDDVVNGQLEGARAAVKAINDFLAILDMGIRLQWVRLAEDMTPFYKFSVYVKTDSGDKDYVHLGMEIGGGEWEHIDSYSSSSAFGRLSEDGWQSLIRGIKAKQITSTLMCV